MAPSAKHDNDMMIILAIRNGLHLPLASLHTAQVLMDVTFAQVDQWSD